MHMLIAPSLHAVLTGKRGVQGTQPAPCPHRPSRLYTHIYPLQVTVRLWGRHHRIISVDDGHNVHTQKLMQRAVQISSLLVIMEVQICDQDLERKKWHSCVRSQYHIDINKNNNEIPRQ